MIPRLKELYSKEIKLTLKEKFSFKKCLELFFGKRNSYCWNPHSST